MFSCVYICIWKFARHLIKPIYISVTSDIVIPEQGEAVQRLTHIADADARKLSHNSAWN